MIRSTILAVDPAHLAEGPVGNAVLLGVVDGRAYVHTAPRAKMQRHEHTGGNLLDPRAYRLLADGEAPSDPEALVRVTNEPPTYPWGDDFEVVFDPSPAPFRWDDFAAARPDIARPAESDEPGPLVPHHWLGE